MICSIGAVSATDLDDNSTVEVSSDVDDDISVDDASITDDVEQSQDVASTNAATWDELKTACQGSEDKVITLTGQSYNADSQIVFGNSATIIGSSDSYITTNNANFVPFLNSNSNLNITFLNVTFKDSSCKMFIQSAGNNELTNCIFSNITTAKGQTSVVYNTQGLMNLDNCNFTNCTSDDTNLLKSLNIKSIRFNQPIVLNPDDVASLTVNNKLASSSVTSNGNVTSSQWAMAGHDAQNSGQSAYDGIKSLKVLWNNTFSLTLISSPIIDEEGNIYLVNGKTISSFYNNGTSRWNFSAWSSLAGIALYNDYIFAPNSGNKLYVINKTTGKGDSSNIYQLSSAFTPIVDSDGNVYASHEYPYDGPSGGWSGTHWVGVASYNNDTQAVDYGKYGFSASLIELSNNPGYGSPGTLSAPVLDKLGNVWVNTIEGIIGANIESGNNIFKISNAGTSGRPVVGDNNVVYCFGNDNAIFALNAAGIVWNTTVPDGIGKVLAIDNGNNVLYTVNAKGVVYKIDGLTGNISEFYDIESTVSSAIMLGADGTLYLGDDDGTFWIIGADGTLLDSCNLGSAIVGLPAMDKTGNIYVGTKNTLYVFTSKMDSNISADAENIDVGENATIIAKLPTDAVGYVSFTVNNEISFVKIENGTAKLILKIYFLEFIM